MNGFGCSKLLPVEKSFMRKAMRVSSAVPTICYICRDCCVQDPYCSEENAACNQNVWESISAAFQSPDFNAIRVKYSQFVNYKSDSLTLSRLVTLQAMHQLSLSVVCGSSRAISCCSIHRSLRPLQSAICSARERAPVRLLRAVARRKLDLLKTRLGSLLSAFCFLLSVLSLSLCFLLSALCSLFSLCSLCFLHLFSALCSLLCFRCRRDSELCGVADTLLYDV